MFCPLGGAKKKVSAQGLIIQLTGSTTAVDSQHLKFKELNISLTRNY